MNKFLVAFIAMVTLALPVNAAEQCTTYKTSNADLAADDYYVIADVCDSPCRNAVFVYEETNGFGGLQRDDVNVDDTCGQIPSDTLVYASRSS